MQSCTQGETRGDASKHPHTEKHQHRRIPTHICQGTHRHANTDMHPNTGTHAHPNTHVHEHSCTHVGTRSCVQAPAVLVHTHTHAVHAHTCMVYADTHCTQMLRHPQPYPGAAAPRPSRSPRGLLPSTGQGQPGRCLPACPGRIGAAAGPYRDRTGTRAHTAPRSPAQRPGMLRRLQPPISPHLQAGPCPRGAAGNTP